MHRLKKKPLRQLGLVKDSKITSLECTSVSKQIISP